MRILFTHRIGYILNEADANELPSYMREVCAKYMAEAENKNVFVPDYALVTEIAIDTEDIINDSLKEFLKIIDKRNTSLVIINVTPKPNGPGGELCTTAYDGIDYLLEQFGFNIFYKTCPLTTGLAKTPDYIVHAFVGDTDDGFNFKHKDYWENKIK